MTEETPLLAQTRAAFTHHRQGRQKANARVEEPPALGDVYAVRGAAHGGVRWVVMSQDPSHKERYQLVPADSNELRGSADIKVADAAELGPMVLRCRFATWVEREHLKPRWRVGNVGPRVAEKARSIWSAISGGVAVGTVVAREVDGEVGYQDWLEEVVVPACGALEGMGKEKVEDQTESSTETLVELAVEPPVEPPTNEAPKPTMSESSWLRKRMIYSLAASLVLAFGSAHLWKLHQRLETLENTGRVVEEQYKERVEKLEEKHQHAVGRLEEERQRTLKRLEDERQQIADRLKSEEQKAEELRKRMATLDQQLDEAEAAAEVVNPVIAFFRPPAEAERGKVEVKIRPEQSYVVLFVSLREPSPAPRYQLKVRVKGSGEVVWESDRLVVESPGEIRAGISGKVLQQGKYEVELLALEGETFQPVAEYELLVLRSSDTP